MVIFLLLAFKPLTPPHGPSHLYSFNLINLRMTQLILAVTVPGGEVLVAGGQSLGGGMED